MQFVLGSMRSALLRALVGALLFSFALPSGCTGEASGGDAGFDGSLIDACPECGDAGPVGDAPSDSGPHADSVGDSSPDSADSAAPVGDAPSPVDTGADAAVADAEPDAAPPMDADAGPLLDAVFDADAVADGTDTTEQDGADTTEQDAADAQDTGTPAPTGTWDDPIPVTTFPFVHASDTTFAAAVVDSYACAPETTEGGGEVVYALSIPSGAHLTVSVDDLAGDPVDVDVHVLSTPDPTACLARHDTTISLDVPAGEVIVVVDTWSNAEGEPLPGPYLVAMKLQGNQGTCGTNPIECPNTPPAPAALPPEPPGIGGCPPGMTLVDTFCIDRWEAALVDATTSAPWSPYAHPTGALRAVSVPGVVPQSYISQTAAADACTTAGKRLCTDAEWLRACQGPTATTFPYGPAKHPGFCNDARICHPAVQRFETVASWIWSSLGDACIAQLPWGLVETGAYAACESAEGAFDMVGNLHEWTADPDGTFRGGFYVDTAINGAGCTYVTKAHDVSHWDYSTGFRCCADAP